MRSGSREGWLAHVLLLHPDRRFLGSELSRATGARDYVMYPLLQRWIKAGWVESGWTGKPGRRFYQLTEAGKPELRKLAASE